MYFCSMQTYRWKWPLQADAVRVKEFSARLNNLPMALAQILINRGIDTYDKARCYFRPNLQMLHDPFLMKGMNQAVKRLVEAIKNNEKILIYGDYDVDGTTAVTLVYDFLKRYYSLVDFYIPDRHKEGYGLSSQGVDYAYEQDCSLIITLDCGIKDTARIWYAMEKGIDVIVCDHHQPDAELPPAVAILNPKQQDCGYPFKELTGCGVGFKLMQAFAQRNGISSQELFEYLDLVAVSIAADIVPIVDENRVLTYFGLKKLNENPLPGLKAILDTAKFEKKEINVSDVVFILAPRINAAGRIKNARNAVETLLSKNMDQAVAHALLIDELNQNRREFDETATREALSIIQNSQEYMLRKTIVVYKEDWHKGVVGIVASRLIEHYYRPTIVFTSSEGELLSGSARSIQGFDLYSALTACSDLVEQFGGHKYAAGLTIKRKNLELFMHRFEEVVSSTLLDEQLSPAIEIDAEISLTDITPKFLRILKQMAPYGPGNMNPVFVSRKLMAGKYVSVVGNNHLKLSLKQQGQPSDLYFPAIGFDMGKYYASISQGASFDAVYSIEENHYNGKVTYQLKIKDLRLE